MIVIIDGYNLLHAAFDDPKNERTRNKMIQVFNRYARIKKHHIIIVFDAGPFYWSSIAQSGQVEVVFSGQNHSADQYITQYISDHRAQDMLLVSSDRQVRLAADRYEIPSIASDEFYKIIMHILQVNEQKNTIQHELVKLTDTINQELDTLMHEVVKDTSLKNVILESELVSLYPKKESKKDRKLWHKIKKL